MIERITSAQNPKIKHLLALQEKSRLRREEEEGLFVVEGRRELEHCLAAGFQLDTLFLCPEICPDFAAARTVYVSKEVYAKIAYRGGTEGIIAEVRWKERSLADLLPSGHAPLIMVLESIEKPGNLGAVLRSADAAGADGVILCDPLTDLYNPNLIRASIGAIFTVPVVACTSAEAIAWLKANNIRILTAQLQDSADAHILIPMLGRLDSLNVSVSAAILLYEAVRQRQR